MNDDIDFKKKYLIYKVKYLKLKNKEQRGGNIDEKINIILFKNERCGYCKKFKPVWESITSDYSGNKNYKFIVYDTDKYQDKIKEFKVEGIPTLFKVVGNSKYMYNGPMDDINSILEFIV